MSVSHETSYKYDDDVVASFNEIRMTPVSGLGQLLVHHRTTVQPFVSLFTYRDYWGTTVEAFDLHTAHRGLNVVSDNIVETWQNTYEPTPLSWDTLRDDRTSDDFIEYLRHTPLSPPVSDIEEISAEVRRASTPRDAAEQCVDIVRQTMTYTPGATHVHTSAADAWAEKKGVCQDYSHIVLSMLRSIGIPARYVSGYHYTGTGEIGEPVVVESHAWLAAWLGEWIPFDPTNGKDVGERHIVIAYGRDYGDVSPMRGIFSGGQSTSVDVKVTLTRQHR